MNHLLTDTQDLSATDACTAIVRRTCHFWHAERRILRPLFGLAGADRDVAATLAQREQWRGNQTRRLLERLADQATAAAPLAEPEVLAGVMAVTSFPAYDALGSVADDPERAAALIAHLVRSLTG
jgi:hypothetical protein